jgi:hypothetical protein
MRISERWLVFPILATLFAIIPFAAQAQLAQSREFLSAKSIYFDNQSGNKTVGTNAAAELKKWGKFQIIQDQKHADLVLLLSRDPYKKGDRGAAGGQSGGLDDGDETNCRIPKWNKQRQTQYAYLTVIDSKSGESLWSAEHIWGGLLTGFNSVGERLVKELEKQSKN